MGTRRLASVPVLAGILLTACSAVSTSTVYEPATALAGSSPATAPATSPPAVTPPAASPVSTQATVTGQCTAGIYDLEAKAFYSMATLQSTEPVAGVPANSTEAEAYQLVLTNTGSTAAEIDGFSVVFYTGGDTETTSDTQTFYRPTFLEPGQSLPWTETPWGTYAVGDSATGPFTKGSQGAVDTSATCQLAQWTHP